MTEKNHELIQDRLMRTCAFCQLVLEPDDEVFGFGARVNPDIDISDKEGEFISLTLSLAEKTTVAIVAPQGSPAREAGYDLMFITCSEDCARQLKNSLELELDVFKD
jgi:hypothetical protein